MLAPVISSLDGIYCTQKVSKTLVFPLFNSITMDGRTDGPTDQRTNGPTAGPTDKASYSVACPQLKTGSNYKISYSDIDLS